MDPAVRPLAENRGLAFPGDPAASRHALSAARAARLLAAPNVHGKPNRDVVRPWAGAGDLLGRARARWTVDFPPGMEDREAALYALPYAATRPRAAAGRGRLAGPSWESPAARLRVALARHDRYLATPAAGRQRVFAWLPSETLPDRSLIAFARDDDWFMGLLHWRGHEGWRRRLAPQRYLPRVFESFPFPWPPATPLGRLTRQQDEQRSAIALAARSLDTVRREWLGESARARRTLAALYGTPPDWLLAAHEVLDAAVAAAYGWGADQPVAELVARLLELNRQRSLAP